MVSRPFKEGAWATLAVGLMVLTGCRRITTTTGEVNAVPRSTPGVNRTLPSPVTPSLQPTATPSQPSARPSPSEEGAPNPVPQSSYQPFTSAAYQRAKTSGQPIFLYFYANWCPLCAPQEPVVVELMGSDEVAPWGIAGFRVNYNDSDTDADERALARELGVNYQHTFITIDRNGRQVWRATGTFNREQLRVRLSEIR